MHHTITHLCLLKLLFCFLLVSGISRNLAAEPGKGPALSFGSGSLKPINANHDTEYHSSSVYGGSFDYQWRLSSWLSTSLMVHESGGEGTMPTKSEYKYYKSGIIGLQLKIWMGPLYLGVHGGQYYLTWIESMSAYSGIQQAAGVATASASKPARDGSLRPFPIRVRPLALTKCLTSSWKETGSCWVTAGNEEAFKIVNYHSPYLRPN